MRLLRRGPRRPSRTVRSYVVCAVERTGSSLLAAMLDGTGVAGRPWEYFNREARLEGLDWELPDGEFVARAIELGATPNGVRAAKLMWGHLEDARRRLGGAYGAGGADDRSLLERAYPGARYVWVTRDDAVAQGVSWARAIQTGQWAAPDPRRAEPVYDFDRIEAQVRLALDCRAAWERWFAQHAVEPLALSYERLAADKAGEARRVLAFLGIRAPAGAIGEVAWYRKQADAVSSEWIARYRADSAAARGAPGAGSP